MPPPARRDRRALGGAPGPSSRTSPRSRGVDRSRLSNGGASRYVRLKSTRAASIELRAVQTGAGALALVPPIVEGRETLADDALPEGRGVVQAWQRVGWNVDLEETTQGLPPFARIPDEQALGGHRALHLVVPVLHRLDES